MSKLACRFKVFTGSPQSLYRRERACTATRPEAVKLARGIVRREGPRGSGVVATVVGPTGKQWYSGWWDVGGPTEFIPVARKRRKGA